MLTKGFFKKIVSLILIVINFFNFGILNFSYAVDTDGDASNWTYEKAEHLARRVLFGPTSETIQQLADAGSASNAVDILFPSVDGPDRAQYNTDVESFKNLIGYSSTNSNSNYKLYAYRLYVDPYEAKAKLFGLFEDIFSVQRNGSGIGYIDYPDIENHFSILNEETLGNYKDLIKKVLYDVDNPSYSFAMGDYLDLLNQGNKDNPNENYARELMQLFLMLEYKPREDAEVDGAVRNYEETDVASLAKILTGFRAGDDKVVYFDNDYHNTSTGITFLTGSLKTGDSFSFYDIENNLIDNTKIVESISGNNGLGDNIIDYIFSKRFEEIADFLAWRLYKFYINDNPTQEEIEDIASKIISYNFDILPTVKYLLSSDMMYSQKAMNSLRYKTPKELLIGTLKQIHYNNPGQMDNMLTKEWNLSKLGFTPYYPGSIFGRDGFDDNSNYFNAYFHNQWFSYYATRFIEDKYNGDYTFDFDDFIDDWYSDSEGVIDIKSTSEHTYSGSVDFNNINISLKDDLVIGQQEVQDGTGTKIEDITTKSLSFTTGSLLFEDLTIQTNSGNIIAFDGNFNLDEQTIYSNSGTISYDGLDLDYTSLSAQINDGFTLLSSITPDEYLDYIQENLLSGRELPDDVREKIINYLTHDSEGSEIIFNPTDDTYRNKYLRGSVGVILSQVEFILQSGYDMPNTDTDEGGQTPINNKNSKLVLVELFGGYDWMNGIIPKDEEEFDYYTQIRGSIALDKSELIDLGDFYMNPALSAFEEYYNNGDLKIFNRIGAPDHSRGHDSARIQVSSEYASQTVGTPGLLGSMIQYDENPLNNIVLGTNQPKIYTDGNYLNIGNDALNYNSYYSKDESGEILLLKSTLTDRYYPYNTSSIFSDSMTLNDVGSSDGQSKVGYSLSDKLSFAGNLIDNNLGITYYVSGGGGYDTHNSELSASYNLSDRTKDLSEDITTFFQDMKDEGEDVTIIVYSEFGRTLKVNGTNGTDHGEGGGYFILTTNSKLKQELPEGIYGELTPSMEQQNWLGVGIDYRAVYTKILESLYNVDTTQYFDDYYDLDDYLNSDIPQPSLLRREYSNSYDGRVDINILMDFEDTKMIMSEASYMDVSKGYSTGSLSDVSTRWVNNYYIKDGKPRLFLDNFYQKKDYYFDVELIDNQYYTYSFDYKLTSPVHISSTNQIDLDYDSYLEIYNGTTVNDETSISDLMLFDNSGTGSVTKEFSNGLKMTFQTGSTSVDTLTSGEELTWNGGFILPQEIDKDLFIGSKAEYDGSKLQNLNIGKIVQVGADTLGVGMELNKDVEITIPLVDNTKSYGIITSQDGINWESDENIVVTSSGTELTFNTNHFSYFALLETEPLDCNISISPSKIEFGDSITIKTSSGDGESAELNNGIGSIKVNSTTTDTPENTGEITYNYTVKKGANITVCSSVVTVLENNKEISGTGVTSDETLGDTTVGSGFLLIGNTEPENIYKFTTDEISDLIANEFLSESGDKVAKLDLSEDTNLYTSTGTIDFNRKINTKSSSEKLKYNKKTYKLDDYVTIGTDETIILDKEATLTFYDKGKSSNIVGYKDSNDSDWNFIETSNSECSVTYSSPICAYIDGDDLVVKTLHFTDFGVLTKKSSGGGGGGGGSSSRVKDYCKDGDESGSYYDGTCFSSETKEEETIAEEEKEVAVVTDERNEEENDSLIENDKVSNEDESENIDEINVESLTIDGYEIKYIKGYNISDITKKLSLKIIKYSKISKEDRQFIINKLGDFMIARYKIEILKDTSKENILEYKRAILLLKASFNRLKK